MSSKITVAPEKDETKALAKKKEKHRDHLKKLQSPNRRTSIEMKGAPPSRKEVRNETIKKRNSLYKYSSVQTPDAAGKKTEKKGEKKTEKKKKKKSQDDDDEDDVKIVETRLSTTICCLYSLPVFSLAVMGTLFAISVIPYYETLGVSLTQVAFFTAFSRSWDCLTDPFMGHITDSTRTSLGRRRPFLFIGAPFYAFFTIMLLSPGYLFPSLANTEYMAWWFGLFFVLFYLSDTFTHIPYNSLGPELSPNTKDRNRLYFMQFIVALSGIIVGAVSPPMISIVAIAAYPHTYNVTAVQVAGGYNSTGGYLISQSDATVIVANHAQGFALYITSIIFATCYLLGMYLFAIVVRERPVISETQKKRAALLPSINRSMRNPAFQILMASWLLDNMASVTAGAVLPFYMYYYLEPRKSSDVSGLTDNEWLALFTLALFVMGFIGAPFWNSFANQVGKRKAFLVYNIVGTLSKVATFFVRKGEAVKAFIFCAISGLELGGGFLASAIMADVIDYDEFLTGERREGQFSMLVSFIPKIVSIPGSAVPLAIIAATGFINPINGVIQEQSKFTSNTIIILYAGFPMLCNFISFFIKLRYPILDETYMETYTEGIILHQKHLPARDPISLDLVKPPLTDITDEDHEQILRLEHFSLQTLHELVEKNCDPTFLKVRTRFKIILFVVIFVLSVAGAVVFYPFLTQDAVAWIPSLCEILAGLSVTLVAFFCLQYLSAAKMVKMGVKADIVKRYLDNLEPAPDHEDIFTKPPEIINTLLASPKAGNGRRSLDWSDSNTPSVSITVNQLTESKKEGIV